MITLDKAHKVTLRKASDMPQNRKTSVHNLHAEGLKRNSLAVLADFFWWDAIEAKDLASNDPIALQSIFRRRALINHSLI